MDEDASARLTGVFERHYDEVLAYCVRRIGRTEGEDAASEAFAVASRRVDEIDWDSVRPWLFGVARGVLANRRRGIHRVRRVYGRMAGLAEAPVDSPDEIVVRNAEARDAIAALRQLAPSDRELLMLSAWEGLNSAEIAASLGISVDTARKRLERARGRLARRLQPSSGVVSSPNHTFEWGESQ
jgi:RNA polymerase sigma-70 factor, ECF subfamily